MHSRLAVLLLAAAVLGYAHASRELSEDFTAAASGRQLLQTPNATDCDRSVKHCDTCRYQFYRGTVTKVRRALRGLGVPSHQARLQPYGWRWPAARPLQQRARRKQNAAAAALPPLAGLPCLSSLDPCPPLPSPNPPF